MCKEDIEQLIKNIKIDEKEIEKITINSTDNRKTLYRHLLNT